MKKKYLILSAVIILTVILGVMFTGCSQTEDEYYAEMYEDIKEFNTQYGKILDNLYKANFSVSFDFNTHYNASIERGTEKEKGWDAFEKAYNDFYESIGIQDPNFFEKLFGSKSDAQKNINSYNFQTNAWMDVYTKVEYKQNGSKDFYLKVTTYPAIWENYYDSLLDAIEDENAIKEGREKLEKKDDKNNVVWDVVEATIAGKTETVIRVTDGKDANGNEYDGIEMLSSIVGIVTGEMPTDDIYTFNNGNKIYTNVMQAQYITAYKLTEETQMKYPEIDAPDYGTKEWEAFVNGMPQILSSWNATANTIFMNNLAAMDESLRVGLEDNVDEKYWSKFGEDVVYDWEEVGAMKLTRYTYNYNKKHSKLEQIDYYVEYVKPYFTEKSAADSELELKGDVYYKTHIVADFEYSDSAIKLP